MRLQNVFNTLRNSSFLRREKNYPPLVDEDSLNQLRQLAASSIPLSLDINQEVHNKLLGERLSPFARSGFEFAETRLYQAGDNIRCINWRRYASTGELYINTFHEERRPQCWIITDRRASMRFGTRIRLKASLAAIYALYHLFKAQLHQLDIGTVILDKNLQWYDARSSFANLQPVLQHINAPCPPVADNSYNQLSQVLRLLKARLAPGCLIILISDFADIHNDDMVFLRALSNKHTLSAIHIIDPIEAILPDHGYYHIGQVNSQPTLTLDCNNASQLKQYNLLLRERLERIEVLLKQSGVHYKQAYTNEKLQDIDLP